MASITCRNGETFPKTHKHGSVAEVRQCQGAPADWKPAPEPATAVRDPKNVYLNPKGAPAQLADLGREVTAHHRGSLANLPQPEQPSENWLRKARVDAEARGDSVEANRLTEQLRNLKPILGTLATVKPTGTSGGFRVDPELEAKVPAGRYAVEDDEGLLGFYRVRKMTEGRWAGRTFLDRQASQEHFPVRFAAERARVLKAIAQDVKAAAIRYGRELGVCSQCGRSLTNPDSIAAGIGPVCLARLS